MELSVALQDIMDGFVGRHHAGAQARFQIEAGDRWRLRIRYESRDLPGLCIRSLRVGDVPGLLGFGARLSPAAKDLFGPYPWDAPAALPGAFERAIIQAVSHTDASYVMELADQGVIGHFFLWKAGGNPQSRQHQLEVPELGVAVADAWQGRGLGGLAVRLLQAVATDLRADAIELTTAPANDAGWATYQRCGFEYVGMLRIPLGVDVTAAEAGEVQASQFRDERQMVCVINGASRDRVLAYLAAKRAAAGGSAAP